MHVASITDTEVRVTLETAIDVANGLIEDDLNLRTVLSDATAMAMSWWEPDQASTSAWWHETH